MSRIITLEGDEMGRSFFKKAVKGLKRGAKIATTPHRLALQTAGKALKMTGKAALNYTPGGFVVKNVAKGAGIYPKKKKTGAGIFNPMAAAMAAKRSPAMSQMVQSVANRVQAAQQYSQQPQAWDYGDGMDQQTAAMPQAYSAPYSAPSGGGMDQDYSDGVEFEESTEEYQDEMEGFLGDGDLTSTDGTTADAQPSGAAPTAKKGKKKKKGGAWSKVKGGAKWTGKKLSKAGKAVGKVVLGGLDSIVSRIVKEEIKADGGVIRPDLKARCVAKIQTAASVAMIPAPGAIVGKMVDRAIKKLSGKYTFADYAEDGKNWIFEHKILVAAGALGALLLYRSSSRRGARG